LRCRDEVIKLVLAASGRNTSSSRLECSSNFRPLHRHLCSSGFHIIRRSRFSIHHWIINHRPSLQWPCSEANQKGVKKKFGTRAQPEFRTDNLSKFPLLASTPSPIQTHGTSGNSWEGALYEVLRTKREVRKEVASRRD
jgi:hypothetical protein